MFGFIYQETQSELSGGFFFFQSFFTVENAKMFSFSSPHISAANQSNWSGFSFIYIRIESICADQFFFFKEILFTRRLNLLVHFDFLYGFAIFNL